MNYGFPDDDDENNYDNNYDDDDNRNDSNIIKNYNNPTTITNDVDYNDDNNNDNDNTIPIHLKNYDSYLSDIIIDNDATDEAPKMPLDYYNSIDNFLQAPPPKIKTKSNSKTNSNIINKIHAISGKGSSSSSNKGKEQAPKIRVLPPAPIITNATSKIDNGNNIKSKKKKIEIDHNLLLAAFSYVDQISNDVNDDDDNDGILKEFNTNTNNNNRNKNIWPNNNNDNNIISSSSSMKQPRSAPATTTNVYDTAPKKKGKKNNNNNNSIVKKLRSQTANANSNTFEVSSAMESSDDRRSVLDFDALVSNFQQGLAIKKLKADLQDSKQSMAKSLAFMKQIQSELRF